jgi:NSS family neurotransmitter:Na+ symporter
MSSSRETLGSRLGFLLLTAGCAIGLGNIWRFPYVTGKYGGACFVAFYLFFLAVMGLPLMVMELAIGRASKRTLFGAAKTLSHSHPDGWKVPAGIFCAGCAVLMIFYTTVTGWMLSYTFDYLFGGVSALDTEAIGRHFGALVASPWKNVLFMFLTVAAGSAICGAGLKNGVERITKTLMSGLFVLLLILCVRALFLPGAKEGLKFYLMPSLKSVRETGLSEVVVAAMGQAFFTLSLGVGAITIFGSYIGRDHSLVKESLIIILLDTAVAVLAGVVIFPACKSYGVDVSSGPGLVFLSLPDVFNHMVWPRLWGSVFFLFMSAAAFTTVVAVFENLIAFMIDELNYSRPKAAAVNMIVITFFSLPCALGFNLLSNIHPLGGDSTFLDLEDYIVSDILLPLGSVFVVVFCGAAAAWGWKNFFEEANTGKGMKLPLWTRYYLFTILPLAILALFLIGTVQRWHKPEPEQKEIPQEEVQLPPEGSDEHL